MEKNPQEPKSWRHLQEQIFTLKTLRTIVIIFNPFYYYSRLKRSYLEQNVRLNIK